MKILSKQPTRLLSQSIMLSLLSIGLLITTIPSLQAAPQGNAIDQVLGKLQNNPNYKEFSSVLLGQALPNSPEGINALNELWQNLSEQDQETIAWINPGISDVLAGRVVGTQIGPQAQSQGQNSALVQESETSEVMVTTAFSASSVPSTQVQSAQSFDSGNDSNPNVQYSEVYVDSYASQLKSLDQPQVKKKPEKKPVNDIDLAIEKKSGNDMALRIEKLRADFSRYLCAYNKAEKDQADHSSGKNKIINKKGGLSGYIIKKNNYQVKQVVSEKEKAIKGIKDTLKVSIKIPGIRERMPERTKLLDKYEGLSNTGKIEDASPAELGEVIKQKFKAERELTDEIKESASKEAKGQNVQQGGASSKTKTTGDPISSHDGVSEGGEAGSFPMTISVRPVPDGYISQEYSEGDHTAAEDFVGPQLPPPTNDTEYLDHTHVKTEVTGSTPVDEGTSDSSSSYGGLVNNSGQGNVGGLMGVSVDGLGAGIMVGGGEQNSLPGAIGGIAVGTILGVSVDVGSDQDQSSSSSESVVSDISAPNSDPGAIDNGGDYSGAGAVGGGGDHGFSDPGVSGGESNGGDYSGAGAVGGGGDHGFSDPGVSGGEGNGGDYSGDAAVDAGGGQDNASSSAEPAAPSVSDSAPSTDQGSVDTGGGGEAPPGAGAAAPAPAVAVP